MLDHDLPIPVSRYRRVQTASVIIVTLARATGRSVNRPASHRKQRNPGHGLQRGVEPYPQTGQSGLGNLHPHLLHGIYTALMRQETFDNVTCASRPLPYTSSSLGIYRLILCRRHRLPHGFGIAPRPPEHHAPNSQSIALTRSVRPTDTDLRAIVCLSRLHPRSVSHC
jgi:hypothetical protein